MQISSKILPKIPNFAIFYHTKKGFLTAVNLLYKVLPKQFRGFWLPLFFSFVKNANFLKKFCQQSRISPFLLSEIACLL